MSRWSLPLYRLRLGWLLGHRFLLITHVGRRSGKTRRTCVMVLRFDARSGEAFVAAGSPRADWYQNIHASPAVQVGVGRPPVPSRAAVLDGGGDRGGAGLVP